MGGGRVLNFINAMLGIMSNEENSRRGNGQTTKRGRGVVAYFQSNVRDQSLEFRS